MDETPPQHSSIPQFLLDTQHPWIIEHQQTLELLPDVESILWPPPGTRIKSCPTPAKPFDSSAKSESESETQDDTSTIMVPTDELEEPPDLSHSLSINNNQAGVSHPGWPNARDRLREMQRCPPAALERVCSLHVEVWVHRGHFADERLKAEEWQQGPMDELLDLFELMLTTMTGLKRLRWAILPDFGQGFMDRFATRGLQLHSVTKLEPSPFCEYIS